MQAKSTTVPYEFFDPVYNGSCETPLDIEYNLPDYCPDIQKLLKCRVTPEVSSTMISGDTLTVDGVADVRVLYLDGKGDCVRCAEFTKEFTHSVKLKSAEEKAVASVQASVMHLTCRAVSARRVDIHAAVSLQVLAVVQRKERVTASLEDPSMEKRGRTFPAHQAVNAVCHQFTIEDDLPLKNGKPPIESILRRDVCCRVTESRLSEEQLHVSGAADVAFLYASAMDNTVVEKMTASIDFSQTIDCLGAEDGCVCDLKAITGECTLTPQEDDVGENTSVSVVVKVFLAAFLYKACEVEIIDDAYSVDAPLELRSGQSAFTLVHGIHQEVLKKKCTLPVGGEEIQKVLDLWCQQDSVQSACEKGKITYRVKYTLCLLYLGEQGRVLYAEKQFDQTFTTELGDLAAGKSQTTAHTEVWEYRIVDKNTVEVSAETAASSLLYSVSTVKYLTGASSDENAPGFEKRPRFLLYYAQAGERLWDIAKSHRARIAEVRAQNELYEETVPEAMALLITNKS